MLFSKTDENGYRNVSFVPKNTSEKIDSGIYTLAVHHTMMGTSVILNPVKDQEFVDFKDGIFGEVSNYIDNFYTEESRKLHEALNIKFKTGILLYGPPGTGKSGLAYVAGKKAVQSLNAIVLYITSWDDAIYFSKMYKNKEGCPIIFIHEELDKQCSQWDNGASEEFLTFLDSPISPENVTYIATTNFINDVPASLKGRPSRFALVREIDKLPEPIVKNFVNSMVSDELADRLKINKKEIIYKISESPITIDEIKAIVQSHVILKMTVDEAIESLTKNKVLEAEEEEDNF